MGFVIPSNPNLSVILCFPRNQVISLFQVHIHHATSVLSEDDLLGSDTETILDREFISRFFYLFYKLPSIHTEHIKHFHDTNPGIHSTFIKDFSLGTIFL